MALNGYKPEEIKELSMLEITFELLKNEKHPFVFNDLVKRVAKIKGMSESDVKGRISFLYTDLNVDGRFIALGDNKWGLRTWYPYDQAEEEVTQTIKRKKAKKAEDKAALELEEDLDDEYEDLEDELDELVSDEDDDEDDDDDEDEDEVKHKKIDLDDDDDEVEVEVDDEDDEL